MPITTLISMEIGFWILLERFLSPSFCVADYGTGDSRSREEERRLHRLLPGSQRRRPDHPQQEGPVSARPVPRPEPVQSPGQVPQGKDQVAQKISTAFFTCSSKT